MADESVTKVFHACSQDMEVMLHTVGVLPRPIFDTQVAAAFLGERQQISYGALVQTFCGVSLPKTESLTDWSRRPLTDKQIEYAIDDVKYLIVAYTEMMSRLRELGRVDWVLDELRPLADESHYRADRHEAFRKVKRINSCSRHQLGIARELAAYPVECLDMVVAHELVHLLEPSHNQRFHALLDAYCPNNRALSQRLRQPPIEMY